MTGSLDGVELRRKLCEMLGWERGIRFWHHPWCVEGTGCVTACGGKDDASLPALESDPGVSEPAFARWCNGHGFFWDLYTNHGNKLFSCAVYRPNDSTVAHITDGVTPSEARAKCWLAALERLMGA